MSLAPSFGFKLHGRSIAQFDGRFFSGDEGKLAIGADALQEIIRRHTREAGVRNLERNIAAICRQVARSVVEGKRAKTTVTARTVSKYLGAPKFSFGMAEEKDEVGVATGLVWTEVGGDVIFIEATTMKGKGNLTLTGQLGDVMRESVQAAYSYVRSKARDLGIDEGMFSDSDIHIHFPAGSIPKDGPSAGVAIATTIASVMGERPVRHDVAMTGEITLRGKVLSVGGIKEKVLAAHRANIRKVVLPVGNKKDLTEVPVEVRNELEFVFAERVEDVWAETLLPLYVVKESERKYDQEEYESDRKRRERAEQR